jgi:prophage antirepressor-like protein
MEMKLLTQIDFHGVVLNVYGESEDDIINGNVKFLAKEVAEIIEYAKTSNGSYDVSNMIKTIDEEEKLVRKVFVSGQRREMKFLTEDGLYEVLMRSEKPIAKQWKKEVKKQLKESKDGIIFTRQRKTSAKTHNELHKLIGDEGKCIGLDVELYRMSSYILGLDEINRKESLYQLKKSNIALYDDIMNTAYKCVESFKLLDSEHYMKNTIKALKNKFIDDIDEYNEYVRSHKVMEDEINTLLFGFGDKARRHKITA